jgi:NAD(P)-dependent dehydrogenase (short-subunit alcohol dehydrogenase family)
MSTRERWNRTYDVNVSGTQVATEVFAPLLLKSADPRLVFLTSGLASLNRLSAAYYPPRPAAVPKGWPKEMPAPPSDAYRVSKTALNMAMLEWHYLLQPDGVKVWSVSPGFLATGLGKLGKEALLARGAGTADVGGKFIKDVIQGARDGDVGKVVFNDGSVQPF